MKCIMHLITCSISRVTDDIARKKVDSGTYQFVSKRQWKTEVRDKVIVVPNPVIEPRQQSMEAVNNIPNRSNKPGSEKHSARRSLKGKRKKAH